MKFSFLVFNGYDKYLKSWRFLSFMIRALVASDGASELAKQKLKSSCCSPHACWSQQQISRLTNKRLILSSSWMDFNTNHFHSSLEGLEVDQSDILNISRLQRKPDLAACQKTKDTACTVLHDWQTYLASESGRLWMWCCWEKGHPLSHQERPLSLLAAWTPTPPAFLSSSGLCSLISELNREPNFSHDHFQVMQHWVSVGGPGLTWIQRIDRFSNRWLQMIPHCQRNHFQWNMFPYTWAMVPHEKRGNPSWATAISFSSLNCNESLSSISNEDHSKPYKKWGLTPQSVPLTNQETMVLK